MGQVYAIVQTIAVAWAGAAVAMLAVLWRAGERFERAVDALRRRASQQRSPDQVLRRCSNRLHREPLGDLGGVSRRRRAQPCPSARRPRPGDG
ncbi:MAG: hypothetical protein ACK5OX_19120 [Desertimonas sp.]